MKVGTIIEIITTCKGCRGAEFHCGTVTDKEATHGLLPDSPGYNVILPNGHIWRINENARVKIRYYPSTVL